MIKIVVVLIQFKQFSRMVLEVIGTVFCFYKTYFNNKPHKKKHLTNIKPNIYKKDI